MNQGTRFEQLNAILVAEFEIDPATISPEKNLKETLDLDSLDYVDLVVIIESNFGVKLVEQDFVGLESFQDFYTLIENKLRTRANGEALDGV